MSLQKKKYIKDEGKKEFKFFKTKKKPSDEKEKKEVKQPKKASKKKNIEHTKQNNALLNIIAPMNINFFRNSLAIGENFGTIYGIIKYPDKVASGWLSKLTNIPSTVASISVTPVNPMLLTNVINKNISNARLDLESNDTLKVQRAEKMIEDNEKLLYQIDQNDETVIKAGVNIMAFSDDEEKMKTITRKIQTTINSIRAKSRLLSNLQEQGFKAVSGAFDIDDTIEEITGRIMPLSTLIGGFPFASSGLNDLSGYYFAKDKNGNLMIVDIWHRANDRTNSNITVLGPAGTGKSTAVKHMIIGEYMLGTKIIIIDPEAEYREITKNLGGDVINAGGSKSNKVNILQIKPSPKLEKDDIDDVLEDDVQDDLYSDETSDMAMHIKNVEIFFQLYKKDFSDEHIAIIKECLIELYNQHNIFFDTDITHYKNEDFPIISDLYQYIIKKSQTIHDEYLNTLYKKLILLLKDISEGSDSFIFDGVTTIDPKSNIICLDTSGIQESSNSIKSAQYFNLLNWAWEQMSKDRSERVMLISDEAYLLIDPQVPQTAAFLRNVEKRCRKYEASLVVITHSVVDLLHDSIKNYGQAILDIPTYKLIFGADGENLNQIKNLFKLSEAEQELLENRKRARALFFVGSKRMDIKFDIPDYKFPFFGKSGGR